MEDRIDIKELLILLKNKLLIFCIAILLCGLAGLILRFAYCKVAGPGSEYVFTQTFLVEYGTDPQVGQSYTYINAATWDRIMDMDSFVEMVMAEMTDDSVTEADVRASLSAYLATDLRIPNIEVRNTDEKKAEAILAAAGNAFVKYGDLRKEIDSVEIVDTTGPDIDKNIDRLPQAFILGLIIGIIICAVFFAFKYILSDGIYTLKKASDRFGKPAIAAFDKNGSISEFEKSALEAFVGDKKTYAVFLDRDMPEASRSIYPRSFRMAAVLRISRSGRFSLVASWRLPTGCSAAILSRIRARRVISSIRSGASFRIRVMNPESIRLASF